MKTSIFPLKCFISCLNYVFDLRKYCLKLYIKNKWQLALMTDLRNFHEKIIAQQRMGNLSFKIQFNYNIRFNIYKPIVF